MSSLQKILLWTIAIIVIVFAGTWMRFQAKSVEVYADSEAFIDEPAAAKSDAQSDTTNNRFAETAPGSSDSAPSPITPPEPAVDGKVVSYAFRTADTLKDARRLEELFAGRANIQLDIRVGAGAPLLIVRASPTVQDEIRAVVNFLMKLQQDPATESRSQPQAAAPFDKPSAASNRGLNSAAAHAQNVWRTPVGSQDSANQTGVGNPQPRYGYPMQQQAQLPVVQDRFQAARNRLHEARSDEERTAVRKQLRQLLTDVFAQDMQARENQAKEIETRLAKLRKQYQDRESAKDKIIDLQLEVLEQDAAGLGFPGTQPPKSSPLSTTTSQTANPTANNSFSPSNRSELQFPVKERTLEEYKKTIPMVVADLQKIGHFVESADGKLFAYANTNYPHGPTMILVIDSATGKVVATLMDNNVIGPLEFTREGLASREADGSVKVRVPLPRDSSSSIEPQTTAPSSGSLGQPSATDPIKE